MNFKPYIKYQQNWQNIRILNFLSNFKESRIENVMLKYYDSLWNIKG